MFHLYKIALTCIINIPKYIFIIWTCQREVSRDEGFNYFVSYYWITESWNMLIDAGMVWETDAGQRTSVECRQILFNEKIKSLSPWPPLPHSFWSQPPHAWPLSSSAILSSSASVKTIILHVDTIPHTSQHDQQVSSVSGVRSEGTGDVSRSGPELPGSWSQVSAHGQQEHEWNK